MPESTRTDERPPLDDEPPHANLLFGMPASWEDMVQLGLDPLTGRDVASRR